jgi:hypothetical protein
MVHYTHHQGLVGKTNRVRKTHPTTEMVYHSLANLVLIIHLAFVLFAVFGGLLVLKWRGLAWVHKLLDLILSLENL